MGWYGGQAQREPPVRGGVIARRLRRGDEIMRKLLAMMGAGLISCVCGPQARPDFIALGFLPGKDSSGAHAISADGSTIVGGSNIAGGTIQNSTEAYRWTKTTGMVGRGILSRAQMGVATFSSATAVSADGSVVVGLSISPESAGSATPFEAFRWTAATGMRPLADLPGGAFTSRAIGVSGDGNIAVGSSHSAAASDRPEAFRWTNPGPMVGLGFQPGGQMSSQANGISGDGMVIVGNAGNALGQYGEPVRWLFGTAPAIPLGDLPDGSSSRGEA